MGTRAVTIIKNENGDDICNLYRQYDGYPECHGKELVEFLRDIVIVNGLGASEAEKIANGMGCLAAQIIAHFKDTPGGFYLYPVTQADQGQDYTYIVSFSKKGKSANVKCFNRNDGQLIFAGNADNIKNFTEV